MAVTAKKTSRCACGYPIVRGQQIVFERAIGKWVHIECYSKPRQSEDQLELEV